MPLSDWARTDRRTQPADQQTAQDELSRFFSGLSVPPQVAVISYPRGCRIRRVRVRALEQPPAAKLEGKKPLIVSRRALRQAEAGPGRVADR
jgi:hypothetical protein